MWNQGWQWTLFWFKPLGGFESLLITWHIPWLHFVNANLFISCSLFAQMLITSSSSTHICASAPSPTHPTTHPTISVKSLHFLHYLINLTSNASHRTGQHCMIYELIYYPGFSSLLQFIYVLSENAPFMWDKFNNCHNYIKVDKKRDIWKTLRFISTTCISFTLMQLAPWPLTRETINPLNRLIEYNLIVYQHYPHAHFSAI